MIRAQRNKRMVYQIQWCSEPKKKHHWKDKTLIHWILEFQHRTRARGKLKTKKKGKYLMKKKKKKKKKKVSPYRILFDGGWKLSRFVRWLSNGWLSKKKKKKDNDVAQYRSFDSDELHNRNACLIGQREKSQQTRRNSAARKFPDWHYGKHFAQRRRGEVNKSTSMESDFNFW